MIEYLFCEFSNMKTIKLTWLLCVASIFSSIIQGHKLSELRAKIDDIINHAGTINNIIKPIKFLGWGKSSIVYRAEFNSSMKMVAMKLTPILLKGTTDGEYSMYTYMKAINNATVENYGIPTVYYHCADWEGCSLLALTLLEPQFTRILKTTKIRLGDLDVLIIMREFVRITKYMHSCGVCHAWLQPSKMMFRKNQGFVIDFNWSTLVDPGARPDSDCRRVDWKKFLVGMCNLCGLPKDKYPHNNTQKNIENMQNNDGLRLVLLNFAKHALKTKNAEPINYDEMHKIITDEIDRRGVQEPAFVSWLTDAQKNEVRAEWSGGRTPAIEDIA